MYAFENGFEPPPDPEINFEIIYGVFIVIIAAMVVIFWYVSEFFAHLRRNISHMRDIWNVARARARADFGKQMAETRKIIKRWKYGRRRP